MGRDMPQNVFLSYSHEDTEQVGKIETALLAENISFWRDQVHMHAGQVVWEEIEQAIVNSACLLVFISPNSDKNNNIKKEVQLALNHHIPIIPVLRNLSLDHLDSWWKERIGKLYFLEVRNLVSRALDHIVLAIRKYAYRLCKVVASFNMKGGVGKTTLAAQIGTRLRARHKKDVLFIDLDPQQNLSEQFISEKALRELHRKHDSIIGMFEPQKIGKDESLFDPLESDVLSGRDYVGDYSRLCSSAYEEKGDPALDIVVSQFEAIKYTEISVGQHDVAIHNFKRGIEALKRHYDYIFIDCNPSASLLSHAALSSVDHILAPIRPNETAHRGLRFMWRAMSEFYKIQRMPGISVVFNFVNKTGPQYQQDLIRDLRKGESGIYKDVSMFKDKFLDTEIPQADSLLSAIFGSSPMARVKQSLDKLTEEFLGKLDGGFHEQQDLRTSRENKTLQGSTEDYSRSHQSAC